VAKWLGHSPLIAARHYLHTQDAHFDLAAGLGNPAINPATHPPQQTTTHYQPQTKKPANPAEIAGPSRLAEVGKWAQQYSNECGFSAGNPAVSNSGGSKSGNTDAPSGEFPCSNEADAALVDSDLAAIIDAWPELPQAVRAGVVAMVRASRG
jgi:hypothetical protein